MEQLAGLDAAFLYLDAKNAPMHVGGVHLYAPPDVGFGFAEFRAHVAASLDGSPIFRRRVVHVPLRLARPFWVEDPHFDLDAHLQHSALPAPGDWIRLRELAQRMISRPLDPDRPLWHMTFVEGLSGVPELPGNAFAVIVRVHHAAADGAGTLDLFNALWSRTPQQRRRRARHGWRPETVPGPLDLLRRGVTGTLVQPRAAVGWAWKLARGGLGGLFEGGRHSAPLLFRAAKSPFNIPISSRRSFDAVDLPLDGLRAAREPVPGATVNDVVLTVCSGGLRRYLAARADPAPEDLVAMAPISVRASMQDGANRVSAMLVPLESGCADPLLRLGRIHRHAVDSKAYAAAIGARTLADSSRVVPFSLATAAARLYSGMHLSRYHRPPFNLVITNVPGPRETLYLGPAALVRGYGTAPVLDGLGLILVVTSYRDTLTISATAGHEAVPDPDRLVACIRDSFDELSAAAAARREPQRAEARPVARKPRRRVARKGRSLGRG